MRTPAKVYRDSARRYVGTPEDLDYGAMATRKVSRNGLTRIGGTPLTLYRGCRPLRNAPCALTRSSKRGIIPP